MGPLWSWILSVFAPMAGHNADQLVTPEVLAELQKELDACSAEVEDAAKKAKDAEAEAASTMEKCREIEEETTNTIAWFARYGGI